MCLLTTRSASSRTCSRTSHGSSGTWPALDEAAFLLEDKTRDAVERNLQRISEVAIRLGPQAEQFCPEIPWRDVRGLGNQLRHGYDRIDPHIIWRTVQHDLPPLQLAAMVALSRLEDVEEQGSE